jgi:hypothetical protein
LDLKTGKWQTKLDPKDADKIAETRSEQYRLIVMSMGLADALSQLRRLMDLMLSGLLWECHLVYLNDIIFYSITFDQQLERLAFDLERLCKENLKLKASKCQLF